MAPASRLRFAMIGAGMSGILAAIGLRRAFAIALAALLALAGFTVWALESSGVAVVETVRPDGSERATHVWYAQRDGVLWLEAGTPENGWFEDAKARPEVVLRIGGVAKPYRAEPIADPSGHATIRALLREKYGLRDAWITLLFDTSRSVAVRLVPRS